MQHNIYMMNISMARVPTASSRYASFNVAMLRGGRSSAASRIIAMKMGSSPSSLSFRQVQKLHSSFSNTVDKRTFATAKQIIPGQDPLLLFQQDALKRKLCDTDGYRLPDVHWVISVAVDGTNDDTSESLSLLVPPNLRTVGLQRVSNLGIDFIMKRNRPIEKVLLGDTPRPISMLYMQGKYKPGEIVTQWRGEGTCESLPLTNDFIAKIPIYTLTGMVASKRIEEENSDDTIGADHETDSHRMMMERKSHFTQVTQQTRREIESNKIAFEELDESIRLLRFRPTRMEYMEGGPSEILWNRWEWLREDQDSEDDWNEPTQLLPH